MDPKHITSYWMKINLPKLKYLVLRLDYNDCGSTFAKTFFPSLERLEVYTNNLELFINKISSKFLKKCPKLKSIQFNGNYEDHVSNDALSELYDIFKNEKVFVYLGTVGDEHPKQKCLMDYMIDDLDGDPNVLVKYDQELRKFTDWCRQNPEYGSINEC